MWQDKKYQHAIHLKYNNGCLTYLFFIYNRGVILKLRPTPKQEPQTIGPIDGLISVLEPNLTNIVARVIDFI